MKEEKNKIQQNKEIDQKASENQSSTDSSKEKEKDSIFQIITLPKFEKTYENKDLNLFKEDILY